MSILTPPQYNKNEFGESVSHNEDGSFMLIGQPNANVNNEDGSGVAYLYQKSGTEYIVSHTFEPENEIPFTRSDGFVMNLHNIEFGKSVSINKDATRLVITAPGGYTRPGYAYIFHKENDIWVRKAVLSSVNYPTEFSNYGQVCAISGDGNKIAIQENKGSGFCFVYSYVNDSWDLTDTLTTGLNTLRTMDMNEDGTVILVNGRVYQYDGSAYIQTVLSINKHRFASLSDDGLTAIVGHKEPYGVEIFKYDGSSWNSVIEFTTENWRDGINDFAGVVAISGNGRVLVMGNMNSNEYAVYELIDNTWTEQLVHTQPNAIWFGRFVSISSDGTQYAVTELRGLKVHTYEYTPATVYTDYSGGSGSSQEQSSSSTPTIYYNTAPIVERFAASITDASSLSFTLPLPSDLKHYKLTLLHETAINANPVFVGDVFFNSTEKVIVPVVSQKITAQSFTDNVLTFTFDSNYSGEFVLSVMRSS